MANKEQIEQRFEKMLMPIVEENNFELVDVEYVKEAGTWYLRAYIDKEGGFSVNDCEFVSRKVSDLLDKEDFIEEAYILEISSPGLGRALKKEKDFARSIGKEVDVKLYKAINKQKDFTGVLDSYDSEKVTLKFSDDSAMDFLRKDIAQIRLSIDF
jgi:ribosome maturation factor RimP